MSHDRQLPSDEEKTTERPSMKEQDSFVSTLHEVLTELTEALGGEVTPSLMRSWGLALDDLSPGMLRSGCKQTLKMHKNYLPTPAQFRFYLEDSTPAPYRKRRHEDCLVCAGTGWKLIRNPDGGNWATRCDGRGEPEIRQ